MTRRNWYFFACFGFYLIGGLLLRVVLLKHFVPSEFHHPRLLVHIFGTGLRCDAAVGLIVLAPLFFVLQMVSDKVFNSGWFQFLIKSVTVLYFIEQLFMFVVEYAFFDEFNSRFNTVAVDYLIYPQEVFVNIWQSYPVIKILTAVVAVGVTISFILNRIYRRRVETRTSVQRRLTGMITYTATIAVFLLLQVHEPGNFTQDRIVYEVTLNGIESFFDAAITHELHYPYFYLTLPREEAYQRCRTLLAKSGTFTSNGYSTERIIKGDNRPHPKNLVLILVESFGSEFWGSLGRKEPTLTPEMDALAHEGWLFTNMYASGNRTVRGMEGVLASFPPLPGDSIVKRSLSDNVSTIARTLASQGYQTLFMYGGRGVFDGMRSFTTRNGYDRFIEQKDFPSPTFKTIWGVCDEDLFNKGIDELKTLHDSGKPFFVTFLTVSNHKPYTYPKGRIAENPDEHSRSHAVKYTDWAIGQFIKNAKEESFYKDTVFAVVADHGARVYGSQKIPIPSYRIPLLIVGPGISARRIDTLGGSLDVGPTLLGMLGKSYKSAFFGQDILKKDPMTAWAVMHHNRDVGLFKNNRLAVLGINKTIDFYELSADRNNLEPLSRVGPAEEEVKKDAMAIFQVADELYTQQRYNVK